MLRKLKSGHGPIHSIFFWVGRVSEPVKHLIMHVSICAVLTIGCLSLKGLFDTDVKWFLVCGSGFALIYLGTVYLWLKKGTYA